MTKCCRCGFYITSRVLGEAARSLPEDVQKLAPEIPWSKIIGMRNILVHGYFEIDTQIVWNTVQKDLPPLKCAIESLLRKLEDMQ